MICHRKKLPAKRLGITAKPFGWSPVIENQNKDFLNERMHDTCRSFCWVFFFFFFFGGGGFNVKRALCFRLFRNDDMVELKTQIWRQWSNYESDLISFSDYSIQWKVSQWNLVSENDTILHPGIPSSVHPCNLIDSRGYVAKRLFGAQISQQWQTHIRENTLRNENIVTHGR